MNIIVFITNLLIHSMNKALIPETVSNVLAPVVFEQNAIYDPSTSKQYIEGQVMKNMMHNFTLASYTVVKCYRKDHY